MNKLRLIKIYELRKQVHPIEKYIIDLLKDIEKVKISNYLYYTKERYDLFCYDRQTKRIDIYDIFKIEFREIIKCSYDELCLIMKYLLEKHLKIEIEYVE